MSDDKMAEAEGDYINMGIPRASDGVNPDGPLLPHGYPFGLSGPPPFPQPPPGTMFSSPPPRALPSPLPQPLFDSVKLVPGRPYTEIHMFREPRYCVVKEGVTEKDNHRTNLDQAGTLNYPNEFSVLGFNYATNEDVSPEDHAKIVSGLLTYMHCGNRIYLEMPLIGMPSERRRRPVSEVVAQVVIRQNEIDTKKVRITHEEAMKELQALRERIADDLVCGFIIGRAALRLRGGELFGVKYSWQEPILVSKPVMLYAFIEGLLWAPI